MQSRYLPSLAKVAQPTLAMVKKSPGYSQTITELYLEYPKKL
jgi:hypothetical protein